MKRCRKCNREYDDETLNFCLEDGTPLVDGEALDEPATAILPASPITHEEATRAFENEPKSRHPAASRRNTLIAAAVGIMLVTALGLGSYLYYGRSSEQISSLAVMPFVNESGNPEIEYLSDGMTETLISSLSRIPKLSVKARSSVFRYKGKDVEPQKVAQDLGVQAIITGRVLQRGDSLTLNLEMVDVQTGDQIWGEQYNRKLTDLVTLQSDIARDVSNKLRARLSGAEERKVARTSTTNPEAYQLYLQGRYFWNKRTEADIRKSIDYFQNAIDKDPTYALAYSGLADAYSVLPSYTNDMGLDAYPKARAAALKALELDDSLAEPHATLGSVLAEHDWNFAESEKEYKRAIELNPNYATAHHWYAEYLLSMGRDDEALAEIKRAQELDPLSLIINGIVGVVHAVRGEHEQAVAQLKKTIEMDPNFARAHLFLADTYRAQGMYEEAIGEQEKHVTLLGLPPDKAALMAEALRSAYRKSGKKGYYRKQLELIEAVRASNPKITPPLFIMAAVHAEIGETEKAFEYLEKSYSQREPDMVRLPRIKSFDLMRSDPRYAHLVRRIGLPQ
jgi:TolB-like protein/lipopolysaccharide biosynthesis regulator YciM